MWPILEVISKPGNIKDSCGPDLGGRPTSGWASSESTPWPRRGDTPVGGRLAAPDPQASEVGDGLQARFSGLVLAALRRPLLALEFALWHGCYKHARRSCHPSVSRYAPELNGLPAEDRSQRLTIELIGGRTSTRLPMPESTRTIIHGLVGDRSIAVPAVLDPGRQVRERGIWLMRAVSYRRAIACSDCPR